MASEVVREVAGRRFAAEAPGLPGVMAYGETAAQAQMRAAVVALRVMVLREDGADTSACVPTMAPAVRASRVRFGVLVVWVDMLLFVALRVWLPHGSTRLRGAP